MRFTVKSSSLVALALFVASCSRDLAIPPPPPTPQEAWLAGALDTAGHVPAAENEVRLVNALSGERAWQRTDGDGGFLFGGLRAGSYLVQADVPGFAPLREGPFMVVAGQVADAGVLPLVWLASTPQEAFLAGKVVVAGGSTGSGDGGAGDAGLDADGGSGGRPSDAMGATVTFSLEQGSKPAVKIAESPVDAFGGFSTRLPPGSYTLEVTHPYYLSDKRTGVALGEGQRLDLSTQPMVLGLNPATVTGTVLLEVESSAAGASTRPGVGAKVTSDTGFTSPPADLAGAFSLGGLAAGTRRLSFELDGYHDATATHLVTLAAGETKALPPVTLLLNRGDVAGRVRMSDGSQLDGVTVFVAGAADAGVGGYSTPVARSATDDTMGEFVLRGLPVGSYNLVAHRTNYVDAQSPTLQVKVGEVTRLGTELRLARLQGDFDIEDADQGNTPHFTRSLDVTLVLSNVTAAAEFRVAEGGPQALQAAPYQPYAIPRIAYHLTPGEGTKTVYLQIKNTSGNEGAPLSSTITLDQTPPDNLSLSLAGGTGFTRIASSLPVTLTATDVGGVRQVVLAAPDADGGVPTADGGVALDGAALLVGTTKDFVRDTSFDRPAGGDGVQDVLAQFIDHAGNASSIVRASVVVDTQGPTSSSLEIVRGARSTVDGYTNSLMVELMEGWSPEPNGGYVLVKLANDAADLAASPAQPVRARASWFLDPQGEGLKKVHYLFLDAAGNPGSTGFASITYDATPPQVTATLLSPTPTSSTNVTIGLSTVETAPYSPDAGLALSESALFTNALTLPYPSNGEAAFPLSSGDGAKTVYVRVRDAAGNDGTASVSAELDTTAPSGLGIALTGALKDGTSSSTLTASSTVTVNLAHVGATRLLFGDATLGVQGDGGPATCPAPDATWKAITGNSVANHPLPGSGSTRTVGACFADAAGNVAGPVFASIDYDGAAPTGCQLQLTGLRLLGQPTGNGKTALRSVPFAFTSCTEPPLEVALTEQLSVTCDANAQGLTWAPFSAVANELTLSSVDALKTVRGCVRDAARNTAAFTEAGLTLDTTAPTNVRIQLNGGAAYINAAQADGGVALASVQGTAVGASEWAIAEDGTTPTSFVSYATQNPQVLALSAGDGLKKVHALFRDDVGNTTSEVSDDIEVDTAVPTFTSLTLVGALADGTTSTTTTTATQVTANLVQTGATTVVFGNDALTECPASGYAPLVGNSARVDLTGSGTTRTVKACVGDAAGNVSSLVTATIQFDGAGPSGCALVLTGLRADTQAATTGDAVGKTGRRDVQYTVTSCTETPVEIVLTESAVSCAANASLNWTLYNASATNTFTLGGLDAPKTVRGCVRDAAHNTEALTAAGITLDLTPPSGGSVVVDDGAAWVNLQQKTARGGANQVMVKGTATDATEWALAENATPSAFTTLTANAVSFTFSAGDGKKVVRALFRDDVGNTTLSDASDDIEFDTVPPTLASVNLTGSLADGTASDVSTASTSVLATLVQTGATAVATGGALMTTCPAPPGAWSSYSGGAVQATLTDSGSPRILSVCVADQAGNTAGPVTDSIGVDLQGPTGCTLLMAGRRADGSATSLDKTALRDIGFSLTGCVEAPTEVFLTESTSVTCSASANFDWRPLTGNDTLTLSAVDGPKTVRGCVRDAAHNVGPVALDSIVLDTTPPTGVALSIRAGAAYFNAADFGANVPNSNATPVTGTATGALEWALAEGTAPSAFTAFSSPTTSSFTLSAGEGTRTVRALFRDDVGNLSVEAQDSIDVDLTPPTLATVSLAGTLADGLPSNTNTTTTSVAATFSHTGAVQAQLVDGAVTSCPTTGYTALNGVTLSLALPGTGAVRTVKACVADAAGNTAGPLLAGTMTVDTTSPTGCALVLAGKTVGGTTTSGTTVNKTARSDVGISLSGCSEPPLEVALAEAASVSCTTTAPLDWQPLSNAAFTLSSVDGTKTVRGCVRDAAHNVASFVADDIALDTTPPGAPSVSIKTGAAYFNLADFTGAGSLNAMAVSGAAVGAVEWALAEGATPSTFAAFSSPTTFTFSAADGKKTIRALFRDDVGNVTPLEAVDDIEVDTTPPTLTGMTLSGTLADGSASTQTTATTTVTASLTHTGGVKAYFNGTITTCPATGYSDFSGNLASLVLTGTGVTRTVMACVMDVAGNTAGIVSDTIDVDQSAPSNCALTVVGRRVDGATTSGTTANKTAQRDVAISVTGCPDAVDVALTEATSINCGATNLTWQALSGGAATWTLSAIDAPKMVIGCVRDSTLNTSLAIGDGITLDTTPPSATAVLIKGGAAAFNLGDFVANTPDSNAMSVTGTATGATEWALAEGVTPSTFVAFTSPTISTFNFSAGEGTRTVRALFRDDVGNVSVVEATDAIDVDLTPPTLASLQLTGTLADGLPSTALTVTPAVTATLDQTGGTMVLFDDATMTACPATGYSTLSGATLPISLGGSGTTRTIKVCVADAAGNTAGPATDTIDVDATSPSGCALVLVGRKVSGAATTGTISNKTAQRDVTATLTGCTETPTEIFLTEATSVSCSAASPLAWLPFGGTGAPFTLSSVDTNKTVRGCVRDAAHNVVSFTSDDIDLDTTAPTSAVVAIKSAAAWFNKADFNANVPPSNAMGVTGTAIGASEWAFAEGAAPTSFVSFASPATTTFGFSSGDGSKTLRVLFRDDVGNVTSEVTDTIDVDTAAPTLSTLQLAGTLSDGTASTTSTTTATVTASLTQAGGTLVYFGDGSLSACPTTGYTEFDGLSASATLGGTGTTRTVKACVSDAAGNTAGPATDTIDLDGTAPTGCQLVLVGRRTDGTATSGGLAEYTALRDVGVTMSTCNETVTEVYLTESTSVSCTASNTYTWLPLNAATQVTLSTVDTLKTVRGCVRDAAHNTLSFALDTITLDTTPPTAASVSIKGGAPYFNLADFVANAPDSNAMSVSGTASGATEWAIAESATPSTFTAWPATSPSQLTFSAPEGTKTVLALFRDALGNTTTSEVTDTIEVDLTPPTLTSVALTGTLADGTSSDAMTINTQVQLGLVHSGGTGLYVGDGTLTACPTTGYASFGGASATITLPGSGAVRTVRACISDPAGNVAGYQQDAISVDSLAPSSCALTLVGRKVDGTATGGATLNKTAQALVGVSLGACSETPTEVFLTEAATVNCAASATLTWQAFAAGSTNFTLTGGDAPKTVIGCVRDAAHNVGNLVADGITLDTTPPTGTSVSLHGGAAYFNHANSIAASNSNTMNVTGTASGASEWAWAEGAAPSSFVAFTSPATVSFGFSAGDGTKTIRALFRDDVGNVTPVESSDGIEVDTVDPTLTSIALAGALADGTASSTVTASTGVTVTVVQSGATFVATGNSTFTCPATLAGYTAFNGSTTAATLTDTGASRTVKACVADAAGNVSTLASASITFDATPPASCALTLVGRRTDGASTAGSVPEKTALGLVTASLSSCSETASDIYLLETSGALTCPTAGSPLWQTLSGGTAVAFSLSSGDALKTVKACVRDSARNVSAASFTDTITLDTTPPSAASVSVFGGAAYFNRANSIAASNSNTMNVTGTASGASEWAWAEGAAPSSFVAFTSPATVSFGFSAGNGTKTIRALFRDDVGNVTPVESTDGIEVDTVDPTLTSIALSGTLADGSTSSTLTASTSVAVTVVQSGATYVATGNSTFTCPATLAGYTAFNGSTTSTTLTDTGASRTVKACVADAAGNISSLVSATIAYDATPPTSCALTLVGRRTDGASTAGSVPEKSALATVAASLSGCAETPADIYLLETSGALTCPTPGSALWQTLSGGTAVGFSLSSGDALKTVKACVRDSARNVSATSFTDTITLDTTPPSTASVSLHGGAAYFNLASYNVNAANRMNVTGTATGATEWAWAESAAPTTFGAFTSPTTVANTFSAGQGTKTVRALFRDDVGNVTPSESVSTIEVDTISPTLLSLTLVGTLGDNTSSALTTNTASVTGNLVQSGGTVIAYGDGTFTCPVSLASFTAFSGSSAAITLPGAGTPRTVKACLADAAGNTSATVSDAIDYDAATPSGCAVVLTGRKVDGTATSGPLVDATALRDVGVSLSGCADTNVQVALTEAASVTCSNSVALTWMPLVTTTTFQLTSGDATKTVRGCIRDAALNVGSLTFDTIDLDTTPPDSPQLAVSNSGGYSTSYTVTASGQAAGATEWATALTAAGPFTFAAYGSTPSTKPATFAAPDGAKTLYAKFRDALQNTTAVVIASVIVDTTAPTAPVLLTVDGQNRSARLFWDPSTDTNGIATYQLLCGPTAPPTTVCATATGSMTDGAVLNLQNKADQVFAVRAVDNAGNLSVASGSMSTSVGWRHATMNPGSVQNVRPLDIAVRGSDVYVTYMEVDYNWTGLGGTLKIAVSHDRGLTWTFTTLDPSYGAGRAVAPIGFTSSAVWVASAANYGFPPSDLRAGEVRVYSSVDRGDSWTNVSNANLNSINYYAKTDGLGLVTSGDSMRLWYMLASTASTKHLNLVYADGTAASTSVQTTYDVSNVWGSAPYQVTGGLRSCGGNFTSLNMWRDRNGTGIETNLRAATHYYLPDTTYNDSAGEGFLSSVTYGSGAGQEVGSFDLACVSLPETMQAYVVYNRAPASAWAVGSGNTLLRWDDTSWTSVQSPADPTTTIYSAQDVWAVGGWYYADGTYYDTILRWNGSIWERLPAMTVAGGNSLYDIWGSSSTNVYAVGVGGHIIKWDGSSWAAQTSNTTTQLNGIWGSTSSNVYAVGTSGFITKFNGSVWAAQTSNTTTTLNAVWGSSSSNIYAVGTSGVIMRYNGTAWAAVTSPTASTLYSVWGTSGSDIWAVGSSGTILHCTGAIPCTWATVTSPTTYTLNEVSGTASNEVWAVGSNGTAIKWNGTSWAAVSTNTTNTLYSVWGGAAGGGSANSIYGRRKLSTLGSFTSATELRSDADPVQAPQIWAGGRNVYVLYRDTANRLMLGESVDEATSFTQWTTLESGANKGLFAVMSGENSSDVAAAWTDVNAATFSVLLPAVASTQLTVTPGVGATSLAWNAIPGVDRYQVDTDPDGALPWASSDFTSLTQGTVPTPAGLAPYTQVRGVDSRNMPGNTGEVWQVRPFADTTLTTFSYSPNPSNTGGVVAYNEKVMVWPPQYSIGGNELTVYRSSDYGLNWTTHSPATSSASNGVRAMAGVNGRAALFFEDTASLSSLKAWVYPDLASNAPTLVTLHAATVGVDLIAAKASVGNEGVVVAYADVPNDIIRVQYSNSTMTTFYSVASIATTAANTIGALEVAKVDLSTGRFVIAWREYTATAGEVRTDLMRFAESTNYGASWGAATTLTTGTFSTSSASASYWLGNTQLAGANNGGYSVLTHVSAANNFWNTNANLQLTVTGSDHSTAVSSATYANFTLDAETVDQNTVDAYANSDGHYLAYRTESFDGSTARLKLAYCVSDCHIAARWNKSQLKSWTSQVPNQGRVVNMTVGQATSSAYDPGLYVLYQEATAGGYRSLKVLSHAVHRRTR